MPAASISSQISQAVYFIAVLSLAAILAKPVYGVYTAAQERGAQATADGVGSMLDSLSPGESVVLKLESYPGVGLAVSLDGSEVRASEGSATSVYHVHWSLPTATLLPGVSYRFVLSGGSVSVKAQNG